MMPAETARDTVAALGQVGLLQFKDLCEDKSPLQRTFANQVCTCPYGSYGSYDSRLVGNPELFLGIWQNLC